MELEPLNPERSERVPEWSERDPEWSERVPEEEEEVKFKTATVFWGLVGNMTTLAVIVVICLVFRDSASPYWRLGPRDGLHVLSFEVNTWSKYAVMVFVQIFSSVPSVITEELVFPEIGFRIYNPDNTKIVGIFRGPLIIMSSLMYMTSNIRSRLMLSLVVFQLDFALIQVLVSDITATLVSVHLLRKKKFVRPVTLREALMCNKV